MNIFDYGILKKINLNSEDDRKTILKKLRSLMVQRLFPIEEVALFQKVLIEQEKREALLSLHYLPKKYSQRPLSRNKTNTLTQKIKFSGKEWEL